MQHRALYMKTYLSFIFFSDINLPVKHCCETLSVSQQLTVSSSTKHTEGNAAFPLQQQLHQHTNVILHEHCLPCYINRCQNHTYHIQTCIQEVIQPKKFRKRSFYISARLQTMGWRIKVQKLVAKAVEKKDAYRYSPLQVWLQTHVTLCVCVFVCVCVRAWGLVCSAFLHFQEYRKRNQ